MPRLRLLLLVLLLPLTARALPPEQETFWGELRALCGQAYSGKIVESTSATDATFAFYTVQDSSCSCSSLSWPPYVAAQRRDSGRMILFSSAAT